MSNSIDLASLQVGGFLKAYDGHGWRSADATDVDVQLDIRCFPDNAKCALSRARTSPRALQGPHEYKSPLNSQDTIYHLVKSICFEAVVPR